MQAETGPDNPGASGVASVPSLDAPSNAACASVMTTPDAFHDRPQRPDPAPAALYESLVEDAFDFTVTILEDFTVGFVSAGIIQRLGRPRAEYIGTSVAAYLHPDDLDRALLHMRSWDDGRAPGGTTMFRLQHHDGEYRAFDVTAARVTDGERDCLAVYCRPVDYQVATDEVLNQLLRGGSRGDAIRPVLDVFSWEVNDSQIAIAWYEPGEGHRFVSTGLPGELAGASDEPGPAWARARATGEPVLDLDQSLLGAELHALATDLGQGGGYWVIPVPDAGSDVAALITVWSQPEVGRPDGHSYGVQVAHSYIELILRWSQHAEALRDAARRDPLTGLANRTALFDALDSGAAHGALLFCDLDRFKPVNDQYGHAAGDEVLRRVAQRIEGAVRAGDVTARTGGDEFVVLAPNVSLEQAAALAQRVRTAVAEPIDLPGGTVAVGVTIGVAHAADALTEATLNGADQALVLAKANARGTVRWAPGPLPQDGPAATAESTEAPTG
jgi:diguanylate cyclase (GGDEF)-like protein/PAS domain S-box-containing protein